MSSVNGYFNPNSIRLGNLHFFFLDHKGIFQWPEGVSSVIGCFNPNSVYLGNLHFSSWITRVSIFQWPKGVPRLMVV